MKKILVSLAIAIITIGNVNAEDQTDYQFSQGSVLIRCMSADDQHQITSELFNIAFPQWIAALQERANEGLIARAHYLEELKQGIFIVVVGKDREQSMKNAEIVLSDINLITTKAVQDSNTALNYDPTDVCQLIEIGPVAVLPMK